MYDELVKRLRDAAKMSEALAVLLPHSEGNATAKLYNEAADAIKELQQYVELYKDGGEAVKKAAETYKAAYIAEHDARVAELQRWIPVTERLPEYGDWVLGIGPKHGYHVCEYRGITHFPYSGDSPWFAAKGRSLTITHWMPLPEPPKEET